MKLARTLEPEVMDSAAEADAYDQMDHDEVNRVFVNDLLEVCATPGDCVDLGTGTAMIPIELCQRVAACRVMAMDQSTAMLDLAVYRLEVEGLTQRVQLMHGDAKETGLADDMFDCVFSNSIVHHVEDPAPVLREALRLSRPGGVIFFRDLMRPESSDAVERLVQQYAADAPALARELFQASLHAALTLDEIREVVQDIGRAPQEVQASSDRHWTWIARR